MNILDEDNTSFITDNSLDEAVFALQREITAENALIEDTFQRNRTGFVTISYRVTNHRDRVPEMRMVTLIIDDGTRIMDQFGNRASFRDLRVGMIVNARFSSNMTRSNPPQARAFSIVIVRDSRSSFTEEGRVLRVESSGGGFGYILTGIPNMPSRQMRYLVSNITQIRNRQGNRIPLKFILPGQMVRIEREAYQTMSIPPQTSALSVQVI
jgi:hypothetical protein